MWQTICLCLPSLNGVERQRILALLGDAIHANCNRELSEIDIGLAFLHFLTPDEALTVLEERRDLIVRSQELVGQRHTQQCNEAQALIQDHILTLLAAELEWLDRTTRRLRLSSQGLERCQT